MQFRSQEKSIREASVQGLIGRYNDSISTLVSNPELALSFFATSGLPEISQDMKKEDVMVYTHLMLNYGILEEAFLLYQRRWISEEDWKQWSNYLERLARHPMFASIHDLVRGTFDKRFEDYVSGKISSNRTATG